MAGEKYIYARDSHKACLLAVSIYIGVVMENEFKEFTREDLIEIIKEQQQEIFRLNGIIKELNIDVLKRNTQINNLVHEGSNVRKKND